MKLKNFSGQYHAGEPVGARMQDITADAKRSRLRAAVGNWELDVGFEAALAAGDERDRCAGRDLTRQPLMNDEEQVA